MKALSLWQPWASLVASGVKYLESRDWKTNHTGLLLIHASKTYDNEGEQWIRENFSPEISAGWFDSLPTGGIVGSANLNFIIDTEDDDEHPIRKQIYLKSPWWDGSRYAFIFDRPQPLTFYPCKGSLKIFNIDYPEHLINSTGTDGRRRAAIRL